MSDGFSRRRILAGISGVGALGAVGGAGTHAVLNDSEQLSESTAQAGTLGLEIDCDSCTQNGNGVAFGFDGLEPGASGTETLEITVEGNAARLWLRTDCPPEVDPLGAVLEVTLRYDPACRSGSGDTLFDGSLNDLRLAFADGLRLDDDCIDGDETVCLTLEWALPADGSDGLAGLSSDLHLEFFAQQCRHVSEADVENPFADAEDCSDPEPACPDCEELGKADIVPDSVSPGDRFPIEAEGDYELEALTVTNKPDGDTVCANFRLLLDGSEDGAPRICKVVVRGGPPDHDSSEDDHPGNGPPDNGPPSGNPPGGNGPASNPNEIEIHPPSTRTGEVCTETTEAGSSGNEIWPAISNVTVYICP
ncbi:hypothetical protein C491_03605 [Natronococcus amylolyticus DSM 10524]|uniref:SipW-cognate class signal peptide n=1 Tax=Natronococcus amylolyticus DSM 10524 TaxID=1227497 RepID=L9XF38_9EURY|nr:SipW-dependent-type signal peptide-containing protein [Natronococcus amylolyticus]ELY60349.1 hypothetical protein C491_03605 [Natronococcus amylolyticus DSM 10524]